MHHPHLHNQFSPTTTATEAIKRRVSYDPQDYQRSYNSLTTKTNRAAASIKQMEEELVAARLRVRILELEAQLQSSTKANDHQAIPLSKRILFHTLHRQQRLRHRLSRDQGCQVISMVVTAATRSSVLVKLILRFIL